MNKTNTLQNLHTIRAGTSHRDNLQLWGPLQQVTIYNIKTNYAKMSTTCPH